MDGASSQSMLRKHRRAEWRHYDVSQRDESWSSSRPSLVYGIKTQMTQMHARVNKNDIHLSLKYFRSIFTVRQMTKTTD